MLFRSGQRIVESGVPGVRSEDARAGVGGFRTGRRSSCGERGEWVERMILTRRRGGAEEEAEEQRGSQKSSAEAAEIPGLRSEAHAAVEGWRERHDEESRCVGMRLKQAPTNGVGRGRGRPPHIAPQNVENSRGVVIDACQMAVLKVGDGVAATM